MSETRQPRPSVKPGHNGRLSTLGAGPFPHEETLDPPDWDSFRSTAHEMLDRMVDFQRDAAKGAAWQAVPEEIDARFRTPVPMTGAGVQGAYQDFLEQVLPYPTGLPHPRFWGWAGGTGSPMGMMADLLASGMNAVPDNFNDGAARVEAQVLEWMKSLMGFPEDASGIITSGASVANLVGLAVARDAVVLDVGDDVDVTRDGVAAVPEKLVLYASTEVHSSVFKAAKILGLGRDAVRLIDVDDDFRIRVPALRRAIGEDRAGGLRPFAIVGTAGTINTGSIDDLNALADLAEEHGLWFHVDGAFGAIAALSPHTRPLVEGLKRADSLAFDFHKWMYVNYEAACVLVRDADAHRRSFSAGGDYLRPLPRGLGSLADMAVGRGLQLSRGFKALKVWMTLKEHGLEKFGRLVRQNVGQAQYLAELIDASPTLMRVAPVPLNVVAFRYDAPDMAGEELDEVNRELLMRIQERQIAIPSPTVIGGRTTLRVCICNHRSRRHDFDEFARAAESIGAEILEERRLGVAVPNA